MKLCAFVFTLFLLALLYMEPQQFLPYIYHVHHIVTA